MPDFFFDAYVFPLVVFSFMQMFLFLMSIICTFYLLDIDVHSNICTFVHLQRAISNKFNLRINICICYTECIDIAMLSKNCISFINFVNLVLICLMCIFFPWLFFSFMQMFSFLMSIMYTFT